MFTACICAFSQTAQLSGTVFDSQAKAIAGTDVVIRNEKTASERNTQTNESGYFVVPFLEPGQYSVSLNANGFKPTVIEHVALETAQKATLNCTLEVGSLQDKVTVHSEVSLLNTTDGAISTVVDRTVVENLPLNGRSFQSLITLTPGVVTNSPQAAAQTGYSGEFSVNGQRTEANRYVVDGVSANNSTFSGGYGSAATTGSLPISSALGTTHSLVSVDALQEFRIQSSTYSAEYGRQPGGQFSFLTRSGTNEAHGSAYDFFRNDALDSNNWFNNAASRAKPPLRQNDFGVTFGGPVIIPKVYSGKNRTFFFISYEGLRLKQPLAATPVYVPSETARQEAPDALKPVLNAFPFVPTSGGRDLGNGLATYFLTDSLPSSLDATSLKLDHIFTSWLHMFFRYSYAPSDSTTRSRSNLDATVFNTRTYTFGVTSPLSPRIVNEFRFGYSPTKGTSSASIDAIGGAMPVDLFALQGIDHTANPTAQVGLVLAYPGYFAGLLETSGTQRQQQLNVTNTTNVALGHHTVKVGVDLLRTSSEFQRTNPNVQLNFDSNAHLLANSSYQSFVAVYARLYPVYSNISTFVQDEWRLNARLNLSLGVRWEVNPPPTAARGILGATIVGDLTNPRSYQIAPQGTPLWNTTYANFAPRLGLAYLLRNSSGHETILRVGGGSFYDTGQQGSAFGLSNGPGVFQRTIYGSSYGSIASFPLTPAQLAVSLSSSLAPPYSTTYTYPRNLQLPYTLQWSASLDQAFGSSQAMTVSYVGAGGRKLLQQTQVVPGSLNPNFSSVIIVSNGLSSSYNALQVEFRRKLTSGLQTLASYSWSHAIDYASQNSSLWYQRGNSDYDLTHNFSGALSYTIPERLPNRHLNNLFSAWSLDSRFTARSGFPVTLQGNLLTNPATGDQFYGGLNLVQGVPLYLYSNTLPGGREINPKAFTLPVGIQQGSAPRNLVRGFGATEIDLAVRRAFTIHESLKLQLRMEAFNILNHPAFGLINSTYGNVLFGQATSTVNSSLGGPTALYQQGGPRSIQLSLKLSF